MSTKQNTISSFQWIAALSAPVFPVFIMHFVKLYVSSAGRGAWFSAFLVSLLTLLILYATIALYKKKEKSGFPYTPTLLFGKRTSFVLCFLGASCFLLYSAVGLSLFVFIVKFYFLPRTPAVFLLILLFLPALTTAKYGFRVFTYTASAAVLALLLFLSLFLFTKNNYLLSNVFPLTEFDLRNTIKTLPFLTVTAPSLCAAMFLLPHCCDTKHIFGKAAVFVGICAVLMLFLYVAGMSYFGEALISRLTLPFYNLSPFFKGNLLERFDIFYMLALLPSAQIFTTFGFSVFHLIWEDLFGVSHGKTKNLRIGVSSLITLLTAGIAYSFLPLWDLYRWSNAFFLFLTLLLLFFTADPFQIIKKRRKESI